MVSLKRGMLLVVVIFLLALTQLSLGLEEAQKVAEIKLGHNVEYTYASPLCGDKWCWVSSSTGAPAGGQLYQ